MSQVRTNCHEKQLPKEICVLSQNPSKVSMLHTSMGNKMKEKENYHYSDHTTPSYILSTNKALKLVNICPLSNHSSEQPDVIHTARNERSKVNKRITHKRSKSSSKSNQYCPTWSREKQGKVGILKKKQTKALLSLSHKKCILTKIVKQTSECPKSATASKKCNQDVKKLYTVIKNVKPAEKCFEFGIVQDFDDDITYLMESLNQSCNFKIRCLSLLSLATKCILEDFRRYLHETDIISHILSYLDDPFSNNNIALCTAVFLFSLSQDARNKNESTVIQSLLIELLQGSKSMQCSSNATNSSGIGVCTINMLPGKLKDKAILVCKQLLHFNEANFDIGSINIATISFKALMNIYVHATEEIKEELYNSRAFHFMIEKVHESIKSPSFRKIICLTEDVSLYDKLMEINQCLQILENACYQNHDTQQFIFQYKNCIAPLDWNRLLKFCLNELFYEPSQTQSPRYYSEKSSYGKEASLPYYVSCLISTLKVLINITHENLNVIVKIGSIMGLMENLLICILQASCLSSNNQFEILILALELIINLIDQCWVNRKKFAVLCLKKYCSDGERVLAVEALIKVLLERLDLVAKLETFKGDENQNEKKVQRGSKKPKESGDTKEVMNSMTNTVLKQADKHMEHSIISAYISVLLGYLADTKRVFVQLIQSNLSSQQIDDATFVANKFLTFIVLTGGISKKGISSLNHVLKIFKSIQQSSNENNES